MSGSRIQYQLENATLTESGKLLPISGAGVLETQKNWLYAWSDTLPTDAAGGYSPGCLFAHTDGDASGILYGNVGTLASCNFDPLITNPTTLSLSSQTTENIGLGLSLTTDSTYLTGDDITYSSARGSSVLKLTGTYSGVGGGFSGLYSMITATGAQSASGAGVIGIKGVVVNSAALTDGNIVGAQFIAKHAHASNGMANEAALIGIEGIAYVSTTGKAGTCIGINATMRDYATAALSGSVHRGIQVVLDNPSIKATEVTGICVWNMAGTHDNVLKVVNGASGFTYFLAMTDDAAPAQSTSTSVTNVGAKGWIKCIIGSAVRYIALGDGVT
jgi:hypothetical protein